jgi:small GTP-binding protein
MDSLNNFDFIFKIIIVGNSGVGKTCLLERLVDDRFSSDFATTIGVDFKLYVMNLDNKVVKLQLWDTAGQERFRGITNSFYRGSNGILLCFDVTQRATFEGLDTWVSQIHQYAVPGLPLVLVGCKGDQVSKREVTQEEAVRYAKHVGSAYIETSSRDNTNVRQAFEFISRALLHDAAQLASTAKTGQLATTKVGGTGSLSTPDKGSWSCCG